LALALLIALSISVAEAQAPATKTLWVAHYRADCVGVGPQKCLLVKEEQYSPWELFYGRIEGFDYVEGYAYELRVVEEKIENPPADSSSIRVRLVEVIGRYDSMEAPDEPVPMPKPPVVAAVAVDPSPPAAPKPATPVAKASPAAVPKTSEPAIRGILRSGLGPETRSFQPCGAREEIWVVDRTDGELWRLYRKLTGGATRPMYVEVQGSLESTPKEGFAANYSRQIVVIEIEQAVSGSRGCDDE
jgi:hypothetical protein